MEPRQAQQLLASILSHTKEIIDVVPFGGKEALPIGAVHGLTTDLLANQQELQKLFTTGGGNRVDPPSLNVIEMPEISKTARLDFLAHSYLNQASLQPTAQTKIRKMGSAGLMVRTADILIHGMHSLFLVTLKPRDQQAIDDYTSKKVAKRAENLEKNVSPLAAQPTKYLSMRHEEEHNHQVAWLCAKTLWATTAERNIRHSLAEVNNTGYGLEEDELKQLAREYRNAYIESAALLLYAQALGPHSAAWLLDNRKASVLNEELRLDECPSPPTHDMLTQCLRDKELMSNLDANSLNDKAHHIAQTCMDMAIHALLTPPLSEPIWDFETQKLTPPKWAFDAAQSFMTEFTAHLQTSKLPQLQPVSSADLDHAVISALRDEIERRNQLIPGGLLSLREINQGLTAPSPPTPEQFGNRRLEAMDDLRKSLGLPVHPDAKPTNTVAAGRIQFRLRTDGHNWQMPFEAETFEPVGAEKLAVEKSLFSPIYRGDFSSQDERDIAVYLDAEKALTWWHRNVARSHYAISGWRRNKVYPDFIFAVKHDDARHAMVVLEMKGQHLAGNDDTEYKKAVLQLMTESFSVERVERIGELDLVEADGASVACELVLMPEWKTRLPGFVR